MEAVKKPSMAATHLAPYIAPREITERDYVRVLKWSTDLQSKFLRDHGMVMSKNKYRYSSYRYITDTMLLFEEIEGIETGAVDGFPVQFYTDGDDIVANMMSKADLTKYLADCEAEYAKGGTAKPYTAWMLVMSPVILKEYRAADSLHACVVLFNHLTRKVYYMDPNATWTYLDGNRREMSQYIDALLSEYFRNTEYEYVWASAWRQPRDLQRFPGRREWDRGNCLTLSIMITHLLIAGDYIDPQDAYDDMLTLLDTGDGSVYNYIMYMNDWSLKTGGDAEAIRRVLERVGVADRKPADEPKRDTEDPKRVDDPKRADDRMQRALDRLREAQLEVERLRAAAPAIETHAINDENDDAWLAAALKEIAVLEGK